MILFSGFALRPRYLLLEAEKLGNIHDKGKQHESAGDEQQDQDGLLGKLREGDDCEHDGVEDDGTVDGIHLTDLGFKYYAAKLIPILSQFVK